jgi:hypothetical protein
MAGKGIFISALAFSVLLVAGCSDFEAPVDPLGPEDPGEKLPAEIDRWIESSLDIFLGQAYEYEGELYLLVTYGEKPTGGYAVEITNISAAEGTLFVTVLFTEPDEEEMVTQALTYPYDLAVAEAVNLPVEFVAAGAEEYIPTLVGLERLQPVAAGSDWIKIFTPEPGEAVSRQFTVEGIANVFEGNVLYRLSTAGGDTLAEGFTTGAMGYWGHIAVDLEIPGNIESGGLLLLELFTHSPMDGSIQDLVQVELQVE